LASRERVDSPRHVAAETTQFFVDPPSRKKGTLDQIKVVTDPGRALITGKWKDVGRFKGPILRGLAGRGPYFHNGAAATLLDVVNFYDKRFQMGLSDQEKADLTHGNASSKWISADLVHSVRTHAALSHPLLDEPIEECSPQGEHLGAAIRLRAGLPLDLTDASSDEVGAVRVVANDGDGIATNGRAGPLRRLAVSHFCLQQRGRLGDQEDH
jgi:hypothetical protein